MPIYEYQHPDTGETIEVDQKMNDFHIYIDYQGTEWKRVYSVPNASIDTQIDDFSSNEFVNKTKGKGMTMGQLWEESKQASNRREKMLGEDPVKKKYFKNYSKKRSGMKHEKDPAKKTPGPIDIG